MESRIVAIPLYPVQTTPWRGSATLPKLLTQLRQGLELSPGLALVHEDLGLLDAHSEVPLVTRHQQGGAGVEGHGVTYRPLLPLSTRSMMSRFSSGVPP